MKRSSMAWIIVLCIFAMTAGCSPQSDNDKSKLPVQLVKPKDIQPDPGAVDLLPDLLTHGSVIGLKPGDIFEVDKNIWKKDTEGTRDGDLPDPYAHINPKSMKLGEKALSLFRVFFEDQKIIRIEFYILSYRDFDGVRSITDRLCEGERMLRYSPSPPGTPPAGGGDWDPVIESIGDCSKTDAGVRQRIKERRVHSGRRHLGYIELSVRLEVATDINNKADQQ